MAEAKNNVVDPSIKEQLTSDEANLYDRQIRLWGLDSQTRLHNAKILLVGLDGLGAEIAKNVILAGVKSVHIVDNKIVSDYDCSAQFFVRNSEIGMHRVTASKPRLRVLNPMVEIIVDSSNIDDKTEEFYKKFDVVAVVDCTVSQIININKHCRKNNVKFLTGDVWGSIGYMFIDLIKHEYTEDIVEKKKVFDKSGESRYEKITTTKKYSDSFVPYESIINLEESQIPNDAEIYYMVKIMQTYDEKYGRRSFEVRPGLSDDYKAVAKPILHKYKLTSLVMRPYIYAQLYAQLNPVCAIVGGVMGQEIIKIVSQKGAPLNNFFCFDPLTLSGHVIKLGYDDTNEDVQMADVQMVDVPMEVSDK